MTTQAKERLVCNFIEVICFEDIIGELVEAVANNLSPDEVFERNQLAEWARDNGYTDEKVKDEE